MAALASPRQPPATVQQLTPPSSSHGGQESWDFAVPLTNSKASHHPEPFMSDDVSSAYPYPPHQPLASQPNGRPRPPRSNTLDSQGQYYEEEQGYLVPNRVNELHKKTSGDISTNSSDPDSLLEYYKDHEAKNGAAAKSKGRKKAPKKIWTEAEKDENNWIHRDKLKEIESRELEEAGYRVGRASRSNSRSQSAGRASRNRTNSEATDTSHHADDRQDRRPMVSPIPAEDEEVEDMGEQNIWDLRTPEEIAAEREQWSPRNHPIRPSTSRIPIARTSPAPVPHTFVERDAPLPRSRTGSANWNGDAIANNGARVRSGSVSSQALLDDTDVPEERLNTPPGPRNHTSPVSSSPTKAKMPGKPNPTSGGRKASSGQRSTGKPRNTSATPAKRPGTSGGSQSRPTTGHRPEGDPPWMATMYKPDPRLPPDQQIIPTHAKRMRQDQWETEGKTGSMYDTEFRLLNTEEFKEKRASQIQPIDIEKAQDDQTWPLPSPTKPSLERVDTNTKSSTNEQAGYKLTPTIPQSPRVPSPNSMSRPVAPSPKPTNTTRVPEPPAEEETEKKGCCCIVM